MCDEYQAIPGVIEATVQAEKDGFDGVIIGCAGDPGVDGAREMVKIPVIGPAQASYVVCSMLGRASPLSRRCRSFWEPRRSW